MILYDVVAALNKTLCCRQQTEHDDDRLLGQHRRVCVRTVGAAVRRPVPVLPAVLQQLLQLPGESMSRLVVSFRNDVCLLRVFVNNWCLCLCANRKFEPELVFS